MWQETETKKRPAGRPAEVSALNQPPAKPSEMKTNSVPVPRLLSFYYFILAEGDEPESNTLWAVDK
jgi:hypothetical protein